MPNHAYNNQEVSSPMARHALMSDFLRNNATIYHLKHNSTSSAGSFTHQLSTLFSVYYKYPPMSKSFILTSDLNLHGIIIKEQARLKPLGKYNSR